MALNQYMLLTALSFFIIACSGQPEKDLSNKNLIPDDFQFPEYGYYCALADSKGNIWFGSRGSGVLKFDGNGFKHYSESLCDQDVSCIYEDDEGNIWFGTTSGACKFNGQEFTHLEIPQSDTSSLWLDKVYPVVNPNQVMSILEDENGFLWFGTNGAGAYKFDGSTFSQHLSDVGMVYEDGQQHNIILTMIEDLNGHIWFSSLSHAGVSQYNGTDFTHYTSELSDDFIRVVFCDSRGNIWIGTHGNHEGGLDKFDGENFTAFYKTDHGLEHNNVSSIYEDKSGLLWLGSGTTELTTFDGSTFKVVSDSQGNTFDKVNFVIGDNQDNIWFGNRYSLWKYNGVEVIEVLSN